MLKGQDLVLLLKLHGKMEHASIRDLASSVGYDLAGTQRALKRLDEAGLYEPSRRVVLRAPAEEFFHHAVKFAFPAQRGGETRGLVTAWAAEPLSSELSRGDELPPVWPDPHGEVRGLEFKPLHPIVPAAAQDDSLLWKQLALVDAIRSHEGVRVNQLARKLLIASLRHER